MNNVKMMGSLLDRLLSYVSSAPERDANYDIAVALLRNYSQLKGLALSQIADLCYTSNASISRFCRFLGMDNFKEFQSWMERDFTMRTDYSRQFYTMLHNNQETAISAYRDALIGNIYTTIAPENAQVIPDIVKTLHDCGKAAYFSHHFLWFFSLNALLYLWCRFFLSSLLLILLKHTVDQFRLSQSGNPP